MPNLSSLSHFGVVWFRNDAQLGVYVAMVIPPNFPVRVTDGINATRIAPDFGSDTRRVDGFILVVWGH